MPSGESPPEARRRLARFAAWLAARIGACLLLLVATGVAQAQPAPAFQVEAVRGTGWDQAAPPADGRTPVALPDSWAVRWPGFDGMV